MHNLTQTSKGQKIITVSLPGNQTVTILVIFATGSKYENRQNNGVSHFLEHMFFKGTSKRPTALAISSELDKIGAEFNAFTSKEYTGYYVKTSSEHINTALDVVSDMLLNPLLDQEEIDRERGVIQEERNMYLDNPMMNMEDVWEELLYGDTPAGWSTIGTKETIDSLQKQDFVDYYHSQYGLNNSFVVIAGQVPNQVENLIEKYFGATRLNQPINKAMVIEQQNEPAIKLHYKKTDQSHLSLGFRTLPYANEYEFTMKLLALILGGSMSSRLFINLRERQGLAYYVRTSIESYSDSGYLTTRAGVPVDKLEQSVKTIINEYRKLIETPIDTEELEKVKGLIHGKLPLSLEGSDDNAQWYATQAVHLAQQSSPRRTIITPEDFLAGIDRVTPEDIHQLAIKIFKESSLNLAVIGPYDNLDNIKLLLKL